MLNSTMDREARQAPQLLRSESARWQRESQAIRAMAAERCTTVLLGRGSSGNVCTFAAYLFALDSGRQPVEFRPWLTTQTVPDADWSDAVAYVFSYSGLSTDIAMVVAVTEAGIAGTHLLYPAHHFIRLGCGPQLAVPATKSVIAQLFVAAALAGYDILDAAEQTAACMKQIEAEEVPQQLARFLTGARTVTWLARGPALGGALDAALKLQEGVGLPASAYSTAEYLHGPIASASPQDRVLIFSGADEPSDSQRAVAATLLARGVPFLSLGFGQHPDVQIPLPFPQDRWARTALLAYISQLCCAALAQAYGINPDEHPSLRTLTQTL